MCRLHRRQPAAMHRKRARTMAMLAATIPTSHTSSPRKKALEEEVLLERGDSVEGESTVGEGWGREQVRGREVGEDVLSSGNVILQVGISCAKTGGENANEQTSTTTTGGAPRDQPLPLCLLQFVIVSLV